MSNRDTIAAISTPPGPGGIGMVRISGADALAVGERIFTPVARESVAGGRPRQARLGRVHPPGKPESPIDQAILVYFRGPRSFTGEDTLEITTHGGPLILREVLEAAMEAGARLAEPGEFTRRAFLNGRMDLSQAEAVASLIFAATEEARRVMLRQLEGGMGREVAPLRALLLEAKVLLESAIDFPEEVDELPMEDLEEKVGEAVGRVERLLQTSREGIALNEGLRVVIVGAPNVGKSRLLNALLREDRAIVHEMAGTTRDFIEGRLRVGGVPMVIVDTAGLREEPDLLEGEGIRRTRDLMGKADMLLVILDGSRATSDGERQLLEETRGIPRVVAVNKNDLEPSPGFRFPEGPFVSISALTGDGMEGLRKAIHDTFTQGGAALEGREGVVTTVRQKEALKRTGEGCRRLLEGYRAGREPELLAVDLDDALVGLAELTGEITVEEVLEEIFSRFCIGK